MTDFKDVVLQADARAKLIDEIAAYAETDLLCYFAEEEKLYAKQVDSWEPILQWLEAEYEVKLNRTQGVMPVPQEPFWRAQMSEFLSAFDDAALVAFATLVTNLGSVLLAWALYSQAFDLKAILAASQLDEEYQQAEWGDDDQIKADLAEKAKKTRAAQAYLASLT
jgi:chaperone required for assembly of F1-ATPase